VFTNDLADGSQGTDLLLTTPAVVSDGGLIGVTFNPDGTANVPANAVSGTYTVEYSVCLEANNTICDAAEVMITIPQTIDAVDDDFTSSPVGAGEITPTVFTNDEGDGGVQGTDALLTTPTVVLDGGLMGITFNPDGTANIPVDAVSGTYTVVYSVCLESDNTICDEAEVQITVEPTIVALDDDFTSTPVDAGGTSPTVFTNDLADGLQGTDNLLTTPDIVSDGGLTGVTFNSDGTANVPADTNSGTYTVVYSVCLESDNTICDEAEVMITVPQTIAALDDDFTANPVGAGEMTPTVFTNDEGDGGVQGTDALLTTPTVVLDGGLTGITFNSDGTANVPLAAVSGTYTVVYSVCLESDNTTICDEAEVQITVEPTIVALDDDFTSIPVGAGETTSTVFTNDLADGSQGTDILLTTPAVVSDNGLIGVTFNSDGTVNIPVDANSGTYTVVYSVCLESDNTICGGSR